jgi:uncharacterized protein (DUF342 family)
MTKANLVCNQNQNIDIVISPVKDNNALTEASIHELIAASEYAHLSVDNANIKNAIAELNSVLKPLQDGQQGREIRYQVLERKDATITITIDNDEMGATAEISTALGGKHLTAKAILNAAKESGVAKGFSKEELVKLAQIAAKEPPASTIKRQIAYGKSAKNGKNGIIKPLVQGAQDRILRPKEREDGSVDMRDMGDIICVKVGDPLAKKLPPTPGLKGYKVTGEPLEPEPGEDIVLVPGEGTELSPKNEDILISKLVGLPRIIENGMEVDEVYQIKNVDIGTGHVKFTGSVIIEGDVCEGMKVIASGDITVGGFVESATLEAGNDITIAGGIIGRKQDVENNAVKDVKMSVNIRAGGSLFAKYCQYAELECEGGIRIENQLMHSLVSTRGRLWVGNEEKADGKLIGGHISAGTSVYSGIVGATAGSNTIITFDDRIHTFKERLDDIEARLQIDSDKTNELKGAVDKLKKLPKNKSNPDLLEKVVNTYKFHAKRMGEILLEKEEVEQQMQNYMCSVSIEATEKLYHGVELIVGDFKDRSRREYGPSRMVYKERKIHINPIVNT